MQAKSRLWQAVTIFALLALFLTTFGGARAVTNQSSEQQAPVGPVVRTSLKNDTLPALRDVLPKPPEPGTTREIPKLPLPKGAVDKLKNTSEAGRPAVVQDKPVEPKMPAPIANFEGVNAIDGVLPPDTEGDIGYDPGTGKKYYMQWVNLSFQIWDVSTPAAPLSVYGPAQGNSLFDGFGGPCETTNDGDPIVLFDHLANRWIGSQFALPNFPNGPFYECIVVSASADPTGAWHRYQFVISNTKMDDYPKLGVWPDAYYMTVNQFSQGSLSWAGAGVVAFERDAMLLGNPADMIYFDVGAETLNFGGMLPSDLDGDVPPVGAPNIFAEWDDSSWLGDPDDTLRLWEFHVDWTTPASSTFGANSNYDPNFTIATADVDPNIDGVPQPDGAPALDAIADRLMFRLQYRNFGTHEALVSNHTVDASGADKAGVHWFELRDNGAGWAMYQEGVYAPDNESRWMGSVALDVNSNLAVGYSVSSTSVYPSIRYAGRLAGDPLNSLAQGETELIAGSGTQQFYIPRWGDYSMMGVDPVDQCTFWYTQEYYEVTGDANWQTRIGSFKFPSCSQGPSGSLEGTVTDQSTGDPIENAKIFLTGGITAYTAADGSYSLTNVPVGTYDVTASKFGYVAETVIGVEILENDTTTQNFALAPAAMAMIEGTVTDGSGHPGMPLYARLDITGFPGSPLFTDPVTGAYSVELPEGDSFTFEVSAQVPGYIAETRVVNVPPGGGTEDFALLVDEAICIAPGYEISGILEAFEGGVLPAGWSNIDNLGGGAWAFNDPGGWGNLTGGSGLFAIVDSDYYGSAADQDTELWTPQLDLSGFPNVSLQFDTVFNYYEGGLDEVADVDVSDDGGVSWTNVWSKSGADYPASHETLDITALAAGEPDVVIRFHYYDANFEWYWQVDNVYVGAPVVSCEAIPGGMVVGNVYDLNTGAPLNGAQVASAADSATTAATPDDPALDDGFYWLFSSLTGSVPFTASMPGGYGDETKNVAIVTDGAVRKNFNLPAGILESDPASFTVTLSQNQTSDQTLVLSNSGTLAAAYELLEVNAPPVVYEANGPFAEVNRRVPNKHRLDLDASFVIGYTPPAAEPLAAGDVVGTWPTGLAYPWGIGFNTTADDLWVSNLGAAGGDDLDYRFLTDGTNTGDTIDTAPWMGAWAADMTYNPSSGMLWQLDVGGGECIHELDPVGMTATGNTICPGFPFSERGLAYDPVSNTYFAGSWNDLVIYHFASDGTMLDSMDVGLPISGLAFNPATQHLFAMVNTDIGFDVYVLDAASGYDLVGGFNIDGLNDFEQAGLEIDCAGHLWAVNQITGEVIEALSGESGVCSWKNIPWLTEDPTSGTVNAGAEALVTLTFDSTGLASGTYEAHLRVLNDTPYGTQIVPVTLIVTDTYNLYLPLILKKP